MGKPMTRILTALALLVASGLQAEEPNLIEQRRSLPARVGPHAVKGHDRPDLRRAWDLLWFGGRLSPEYLDYKNQLADREVRLWDHLMPKATTAKPLLSSKVGAAPAAPAPLTWVNLGPTANLTTASFPDIDSGRPVAILSDPTTPTTLYLATSGGGVFKSTNADTTSASDWTWTSITDALPSSSSSGNVSVGAMAMGTASPSTLYLGSGDAHDAEGRGFFTSTNGGTSWVAATGIGSATRSYAILPLSATIVFWGTNDGLKMSTNGGQSFSAVTVGGATTGRIWSVQMVTSTDLVCSLEPGTGAGTIHYSTTGGSSWTPATISGVTVANIGRITVVAAKDGATLWAIYEDTSTANIARGVLKSVDKGHTWAWMAAPTATGGLFQGIGAQMTGDGGQGFYNHGLAVDPNNANNLFVGSNLALYRSLTGGASWTQLTHWYGNRHVYAHADFHTTAWSATGGTLYVGNDGGLSVVRDPFRASVPTGAGSVNSDPTFIDNRRNKSLATHLVYNIGSTLASTPPDSKYRISLGLQDNGTRIRKPDVTGAALTGAEGTFEDEIGGDGFGTVIHPNNGNLMLGSIYYTAIGRSTDGGATQFTVAQDASGNSITVGIPESGNPALDATGAPFAPKIALGASSTPDTVYTFVNAKVYKSTNFGTSWTAMTMTGYDTTRLLRNVNGSRSSGAVGAASSGGHFWVTYNNGASWTDSTDLTGGTFNTSYIWFNTENDQIVYGATVAPNAAAHHLFKSANGGATWTTLDGSATTSNGLPFGVPIHVIQNVPGNANTLFVGTDFGVYRSTDGGGTWARYGSNLPMVAVRDLYLAPDGSFLRAGTYGRGVWELQTGTGAVSVSLDKATATVNPSATTTFTATVTNFTTDNKTNWTVSAGGGSVSPIQTASGSATTYTAPAAPGVYTVTATSNESAAASATATVNVYNPAAVTVSVTPTPKTLLAGAAFTFTAAVAGAPSQAVTWSASGGTITSAGLYTAPATAGTYTVTATSTWPGTTPGTATVTVKTLDLNGDGVVDLRDLLTFAKFYGQTGAAALLAADLDGNGVIDDADLILLLPGL